MSLAMSHSGPFRGGVQARPARAWLVIALVWMVATGINLGKAVHLDDTAYLETARAILKAPLHPLSQNLNWDDRSEPIHLLNQPPLWSGVMAAVMAAFGDSEIALHMALSLFLGAALGLFHDLARVFVGRRALWFTVLFGLSPAILPSQNLMTDIPMLSLWLGFFVCLVRAEGLGAAVGLYYAGAALLATAACLTKYTSLALLPILVLALVLRRQWKLLWVVLIPAAGLAAWSAFNHYDYGGIHLLSRPEGIEPKGVGHRIGSVLVRCLLWLVALGAVSPFAGIAVGIGLNNRTPRRLLGGLGLLAAVMCVLGQVLRTQESLAQSGLRALFLVVGILMVVRVVACFRGPESRACPSERCRLVLLALWLVGAAAFIVLFSPFTAVRHVLPALPAVLLLLGWKTRDSASIPGLGISLVTTAILGLLLSVSDWCYADAFRATAKRLPATLRPQGNVWSLGHWGWQWYAGKAGLREYDRGRSRLRRGDLVVWPSFIHAQHLDPADAARLSERAAWEAPASPATWLRTVGAGGGFYYFWWDIPWTVTTKPVAEFRLLEVAE
jgi:hypothetical protein